MKNNEGFTLIELLVIVTILSLLIPCLTSILGSNMTSFNAINNRNELQQNLRFTLNTIIQDIRNCKKINKESSAKEISLNLEDDTHIKYGLKMDNQKEEHLYNLEGKVIFREKNYGNKNPLANFIDNLKFLYFKYDPKTNKFRVTDPEKATYIEVEISGVLSNKKKVILRTGVGVKNHEIQKYKQ